MKPEIKKYFQFSRRERNGILVLLFVLVGSIILRVTIPSFFGIDNKEAQTVYQNYKDSSHKNIKKETILLKYSLHPFNPNITSKDSMVKCGVPLKLARQIVNYRNKGGQFRIKKDFAKLYYLTDSSYLIYKPYLLLPDKIKKLKPLIVELNTADSMQLLAVKGIGAFYAYKILKYRREAGGFFTLNQLEEAFYIRANTLDEQQKRMAFIKKQLKVNPKNIKKFNVNTATQKQLSHHPYISYRQSKRIMTLRKKNEIKGWDELIDAKIFTEEEKKNLIYYLKF